jgi:hypothetical protein
MSVADEGNYVVVITQNLHVANNLCDLNNRDRIAFVIGCSLLIQDYDNPA